MSEQLRTDSLKYRSGYQTKSSKMSEGDLGARKTLFVLVIVVGCFAVLWPKVFYPMLIGPTNQRMKPNSLDKGCCDVISDIDVNTIKIMSELCNNIVQIDEKPLKGQEVLIRCRTKILNECGIDISAILQEQVRLGHTFKQIVEQIRSDNASLCLKYKFGLSPSRLGSAHKVTINLSPVYIRQERPSHLRPEMLHPALREKGRAIVQPYHPPIGIPHKYVEGRPGPVPGIRPPLGASGHLVHSQKSSNSMGVIMPIYTIGIVIFFSYTLMKLLFKKKPEGPGAPLYPPVEPSMTFRKEVFESHKSRPSQPSIVNAMTALLDEVDQELEARRRTTDVTSQKETPTDDTALLANGSAKQPQEHDGPSVKVLGMEVTASCEGGQKWSRPESPIIPKSTPPPQEPIEPPQEIYLEGILPAHSQILVADSTVEEEPNSNSSSTDPAVILASKMTLSVISLDSQESDVGNDTDDKLKLPNGNLDKKHDEVDENDAIEESNYTTASGATAAEHDISEDDETNNENEVIEEIDRVPELIVDNGVQDINEDDEEGSESEIEIEVEEVIVYEDDTDEDINANENEERPVREFIEDIEDNKRGVLSHESLENIENMIDDVISAGVHISEIISSERESDLNIKDEEDNGNTENMDNLNKHKDLLKSKDEEEDEYEYEEVEVDEEEEVEVEEVEVEEEEYEEEDEN